jgi:glycosyltransferase involved in cell wall biosynthesis
MIKNTVIITAEKKDKTIIKTIQSCLNQVNKNFEIIVVYSKFEDENMIKKSIKSKKVIFFKIKKKLNNKVQDQLFKIKQSLKISKGKNIFLLDGDDIFNKKKIEIISKIMKHKEIMILDNYFLLINNKKLKNKYIGHKKNYLYKKLINDWPKNVCTSAISIKRELLFKFFEKIKINKYKYLAIDILLAIYCSNERKLLRLDKFLTSKIEIDESVDKDYIGYNNKFYWHRRLEQHKYNFFIKKKKYFNLDFFVSYIFTLLFRF